MVDFGCREFDVDEIVKCSLSLTRAEFKVLAFLLKRQKFMKSDDVAEAMSLDLSTIQKALKKLYGKGILERRQKNLDNGGYVYIYRAENRQKVREIIKGIIREWSKKVGKKIDEW
jgi:predicted transcriptional regulator